LFFIQASTTAKLLFGSTSRHGCFLGFLEAVGSAEFLAESFDSTSGVYKLLFAGEERMTLVTNIDADPRLRAAGHKRVTASAVYRTGHITGMGFLFHDLAPLPERA
jgi:hypothetical protein